MSLAISPENHLHLIEPIAQKIKRRIFFFIELGDLVSAGYLGLHDAAVRFQDSLNIPFECYAKIRIRGAMLDECRKMDWTKKGVRRKISLLKTTRTKLEQELGHEVSDEEIRAKLEMSPAAFQHLREKAVPFSWVNFDWMIPGSSLVLSEIMEDIDAEDALLSLSRKDLITILTQEIASLTSRQQEFVDLHYRKSLSITEVAEIMGVTKPCVCLTRNTVVEKLRRRMNSILLADRAAA